jgi:hypothetical protein
MHDTLHNVVPFIELTDPFIGDKTDKDGGGGVDHVDVSTKRTHNYNLLNGRRKRAGETGEDHNKMMGRTGDVEAEADQATELNLLAGLTDCRTRMVDFMECFEVAMLKV